MKRSKTAPHCTILGEYKSLTILSMQEISPAALGREPGFLEVGLKPKQLILVDKED